jgi:hypothetical protein
MKKVTVKPGWQMGRRLREAGKQLSLDRVLAQFQSALLCIDQFGFCVEVIMGFFTLASVLVQTVRAVVEKGLI